MESLRIWSIEGNSQKLDGGSMFGNAPRAVWQKWYTPDEIGRVSLSCRALLLEIQQKKVLFETGIGAFFEPKMAERYGVEDPENHALLKNLEQQGWSHHDIDFVVLSHLHFDHAGGLLAKYVELQLGHTDLLFPNARYIVGEHAWERALKPHSRDRASFIPGLTDKLQSSHRLEIQRQGEKPVIFPEVIEFFYSDGHTPGQMLSIIKAKDSRVVFCGDLIPGIPWVHVPITMGYDRFPELLIDEKRELYGKLKEDHDILFFTHDPKVCAAKFAKNPKGKYEPTEKLAHLKGLEI